MFLSLTLYGNGNGIGFLYFTVTGNYGVLTRLAKVSPFAHIRSYDTVFGYTALGLQVLEIGAELGYTGDGVGIVVNVILGKYVAVVRPSEDERRDIALFTVGDQQAVIIYRIVVAAL